MDLLKPQYPKLAIQMGESRVAAVKLKSDKQRFWVEAFSEVPIGENVLVVAERLAMLHTPFDLVVAGGVFSSRSELLLKPLTSTVRARAAGAKLVHLAYPPVVGALLLALDLLGPDKMPDTHFLSQNVQNALEQGRTG